jgi:peptidoglycan hydrolase-like protein with peptidoglycan-binding domain
MAKRYAALLGAVLMGALAACQPATPDAVGDPLPVPAPASGATSAPSPSAEPSPSTVSPSKSPSTSPSVKPSSKPPTTCPKGPNQKSVETALAKLGSWGRVTVDGVQSPEDCAAIKKFQQRYGISPANGRAGDTTNSVAKRLAATDPAACQAGTGLVACVDLTHQTTYLMKGGKLIWGPTVTRTGMSGFATPSGWFNVFSRADKHWSTPYEVWLPYWQEFYKGDGFHQTTTYIHDMGIGSHGCVNLLPVDARKYYSTLTSGSKVHLYGRRPGT